MDAYSLNPKIFPSAPMMKPEEHKRHLNRAVLVTIVAIVIGVVYWMIVAKQSTPTIAPTMTQDEKTKAEMLSILRSANVPPPTQQEVNRMLDQIKRDNVQPLSASERAAALEQIRNSQ
jgi:predicted PurR-regulated permease PerM